MPLLHYKNCPRVVPDQSVHFFGVFSNQKIGSEITFLSKVKYNTSNYGATIKNMNLDPTLLNAKNYYSLRSYVSINYIFSLKWIYYCPKEDILDYWGTLIYFLLSYHILSKDKGL